MATTTPDPSNGFSAADQQWFDRLSGKLTSASDPDALREADALRMALTMEKARLDADPELQAALSPQSQAEQWASLRANARAEGLMHPKANPRTWRWPVLAGVVAAVVLGVYLLPYIDSGPAYDPPPQMRGDFTHPIVRVAKPAIAAQDFAAALRNAGLKPGIYRSGKVFYVDVALAPDELSAAAVPLASVGATPAAGFTRVEFDPR